MTKLQSIRNIIINHGVEDISIEFIDKITMPTGSSEHSSASYYGWLGDNLLDNAMVLLYNKQNNFSTSTKILKKLKDHYCCEKRQNYILEKMGLSVYLNHLSEHNKADFFESIIYYIDFMYSMNDVVEFLDKIDFFSVRESEEEIKISNSKELNNKTVEMYKLATLKIDNLTEENATESFIEVFREYYIYINHMYLYRFEENTFEADLIYQIESLYGKYKMERKKLGSFIHKILPIFDSLENIYKIGNHEDIMKINMNKEKVHKYFYEYILLFLSEVVKSQR